jgi:multicomponent Na+:H+ antiporter subunit D
MQWLLALPILLPLTGAVLAVLAWGRPRVHRALALGTSLAMGVVAVLLGVQVHAEGIVVARMGGWSAPQGIILVADALSTTMVVVSSLVALAGSLYALVSLEPERERRGHHLFFLVLMTGVHGAFLTGDLFNLYVWFEVMLIASFVLVVLGGERGQVRGGVTYVVVNLISSALFLTAVGLTYGATGTLNLADLSTELPEVATPGLTVSLAMLFVVAFGIKAGLFPFFFWLPDSYPTTPIAVSAVFAGLLTKVGVYALLRVFTLLFDEDVALTHGVLLALACLTMVIGVLGAAAQTDLRRILSFHIISQIGYMVMGLALWTPLAIAGAIFYVVHHILVKTGLFFVAGLVRRTGGSFELDDLGGLYRSHPTIAWLFAVPALSLAGVPPLSGFWAKLILVRAGLEAGQWLVVAVALIVGALTLYSMCKIWLGAFWKPAPGTRQARQAGGREGWVRALAVTMLGLGTLGIGFWAEPLFAVSTHAAGQLLEPGRYVAAVLGEGP